MRRLLWITVLLGVLALVLTRAEPLAPTVTLETPIDTIGRATPLRVVARDRGSGLARVELRLVPTGGGDPVILAHEEFPRTSWLGSGVFAAELAPTIDAAAAKMPEGPAMLEVWAADHSWMATFRHRPRLVRPVTVDTTPPTLEVLTSQHVLRLGGSECVVYRVGSDTTTSAVVVGSHEFPGTAGVLAEPALRVALFAVPPDTSGAAVTVVATDAAGNRREQRVDATVKPRQFPEKTLDLSDDFLTRKVPELLGQAGLPDTGDLVAGYRRVNGDLRTATEKRVQEVCRESAPAPLWQGAFLRLPNGAPLAGFADRRSYRYKGEIVDHATHMGFDLASLRQSPVPAANTGKVVFAGPLGIYGNAVILDHGLGLFSLYGHLSEVGAHVGATLTRGDPLGKTGDTGLAGGDHLHFGMMIHGTYVDPVEWWDAHWIRDHVDGRLAAYPRPGAPAGTP
ncbi:MAG: M23 family metallopeptidase [Candidatus Binatia bacterium]